MSIEGETEYKAKVRLEARLGEHLNFCPGGLAQNCQHVAGFEPGSCGSETRILPLRHTPIELSCPFATCTCSLPCWTSID